MEQQQRSLIFTAAVGLIILSIIVGSIYYLVKFIQGRVATSRQTTQTEQVADGSVNPEGSVEGTQLSPNADNGIPTPQVNGNPASDKKVYNGSSFQLAYPNNWGVVTCDNAQNFELDPSNSEDSKISCNVATKAVTVLVGDVRGCEGDVSKVGNVDVVKSQGADGNYIKYQWCTKTTPVLNITHRVSPDSDPATTKEDYSRQIEEMISSLSFSTGS
jgi:hypothetical protein